MREPIFRILRRPSSRAFIRRNLTVLGIETSCDDTSAAVSSVRYITTTWGRSDASQLSFHNRFGGTILPLAAAHHELNIHRVVQGALDEAGLDIFSVDRLAVTTRPGLIGCLEVGTAKALALAHSAALPLACVHHMRAHALAARLADPTLEFPFLCLLVSGGHALLAVAAAADRFALLGTTLDVAPGELFDKVARRLRLRFLKAEYRDLSGGRLIELLADGGDPRYLAFPSPLGHRLDCNFSFSPFRGRAEREIWKLEEAESIRGLGFVSKAADIAASLQHAVFHHLARRLCRAIEVLQVLETEGDASAALNSTLVIAGGCAANGYLRKGLTYVAGEYGFRTVVPPVELCGDNGAMIAWAGLETEADVIPAKALPESIWLEHREPIGPDWSARIEDRKWSLQGRVQLNHPQLFL